MRTEQYISKKLKEWTKDEREEFLTAYNEGDWDVVYSMSEDLTGGQYARQITLGELFDRLKMG